MYGSQSQQACTACPQGYYQPNTGQAACLACSSSSFCPVGSVKELPLSSFTASRAALVLESQPGPLPSQLATVTWLQLWILSATGMAVGLLSIVYLVARCCGRFGDSGPALLRSLDLMYQKNHPPGTLHNARPFKSSDQWRLLFIHEWATPEGGFFSILFLIFAITIGLLLFLPYQYDNVGETAALVPFTSIPISERRQLAFDMSGAFLFCTRSISIMRALERLSTL